MRCHATQINDQMHCGPCGLQWDVNDPEPPTCLVTVDFGAVEMRYHAAVNGVPQEELAKLREESSKLLAQHEAFVNNMVPQTGKVKGSADPVDVAATFDTVHAPLFKEGERVHVQPSATPIASKGPAYVVKVGKSSDEPFGVPQYEVRWENGWRAICGQPELSAHKPQHRDPSYTEGHSGSVALFKERLVGMAWLEYEALLTVLMCCDRPTPATERELAILATFADSKAKVFGYSSWIDAYHDVPASERKAPGGPAQEILRGLDDDK